MARNPWCRLRVRCPISITQARRPWSGILHSTASSMRTPVTSTWVQESFDIEGTVTVTTAFAVARLAGRLLANGETYNVAGTVLGRKYLATDGGWIGVQGAGEDRFPGTFPGVVKVRGGSYDGATD